MIVSGAESPGTKAPWNTGGDPRITTIGTRFRLPYHRCTSTVHCGTTAVGTAEDTGEDVLRKNATTSHWNRTTTAARAVVTRGARLQDHRSHLVVPRVPRGTVAMGSLSSGLRTGEGVPSTIENVTVVSASVSTVLEIAGSEIVNTTAVVATRNILATKWITNTNLAACSTGQMTTPSGGRRPLVPVTATKGDGPEAWANGLSFRSTLAASMTNDRLPCHARKADGVVRLRVGIKTGVLRVFVKDPTSSDLQNGKMNLVPCLTDRDHLASEAWKGDHSRPGNILVKICAILT